MALLMWPAVSDGHASIGAIAAMFAFFGWAAVAAVLRRRGAAYGHVAPAGSVADPFAMAILMAVPYLPLFVAGHGHGHGSAAGGSPAAAVVLSASAVVVWAAARLRGGRRRADLGFWSCLPMMAAMLLLPGHGTM